MFSISALQSLLMANGTDMQPLVLATVISVCLLGAALVLTSKERVLKKHGKTIHPRKVPVLPGKLPVLGDVFAILQNKDRYHTWMLECFQKFDFEPWAMFTPGQPRMVVLSDPNQFEEVFTTQFASFRKGEYQNDLLQIYFGKSIIASDGEPWLRQRKMATRFFTARTLRAYMANSAKRNLLEVVDIIEKKQNQGVPVNLTHLIFDFTMQTFAETGLGVKLNWIGSEAPHPFAEAVEAAAPFIAKRFQTPAFIWKTLRFFNVGDEAKLAAYMESSVAWLTEVANESLKAIASKSTTTTDDHGEEIKNLVQLFVEQSREDVEGLRPEDLVPFIQVMILAARDTSAVAMTWIFYELSQNPEIEAKIRAEMASAFPNRVGKNDNYFTADEARSLVYLEATIKESLRLNPSVASMVREASKDLVICDEILVCKGELVMLPLYSVARNPKVWGEDAAVFNPTRWIDQSTGELKQFPTSKFATFSSGPRICLGMSLAMMELRVVIANLISRFDFNYETKPDNSFIIAPLLVMANPLIATMSSPTYSASAA